MIDLAKPQKEQKKHKDKKTRKYEGEDMSQFFFNGTAAPILTTLFSAFFLILAYLCFSIVLSLIFWDNSYTGWVTNNSIKEWKYFSIVVRSLVYVNFAAWWIGSLIYYMGEKKS